MVDRIPIARTTDQLIADAQARQEAFAKVQEVMATVTGTAHDVDNTVEVTVNARGKLLNLWLAPTAANCGAQRLGELIVEVAEVAMREATQNSYNKVALLLGDDLTYAIEELSGLPAPARAENDDSGMTVEEFQRRREERIRAAQPAKPQAPATAASQDGEVDLDSFDPSSLRSDR